MKGQKPPVLWRVFAVLVVGLLAGCADPAAQSLQFDSARVRQPLPGTDKTVGYFDVTNTTAEEIVLVGARSTSARAIEFHSMVQDGDMLRMRRLTVVPIAAGETVSFAPGGNHLMIFGVTELTDPVQLVFVAADGTEYRHDFSTFSIGDAQ